MLCRVYVFLCLFLFSSGEIRTCSISVTRGRPRDQIVPLFYSGVCDQNENPCKQVNGVWKNSRRNCTCLCPKENNFTYREDLRSCVENEKNRQGCNLFFKGEAKTSALRVFNKSNTNQSMRLKTIPRENCKVTQAGTAFMDITGWKLLKSLKSPFTIHHEDLKGNNRHAHFLEWSGAPTPQLFGKIVRVAIECQPTRGPNAQTLRKLCIVFKVQGTISLPCPFQALTPTSGVISTIAMMSTKPTEAVNQTTEETITDHIIITYPPSPAPPDPPTTDKNKQPASNRKDQEGLPVWLIGVVAGAAVLATLIITAIIWMCCKMKRRSTRKRTRKRNNLGNSRHHPGDETVITFAPNGGGQGTDEAGYTRCGTPTSRIGYAQLKTAPHRTPSEYQRLLKPGEDLSGYLVPVEERASRDCAQEDIYTEPQSVEPQTQPRSTDYDYAKPEDIILLDRNHLFNISQVMGGNSDCATENSTEADYVGTRGMDSQSIESNDDDDPASPVYNVVEGPGSPGGPAEQAPPVNELEDHTAGYVEVLPATDTEKGLTTKLSELEDPKPGYVEVLPPTLTDTDREGLTTKLSENTET